jgi:hypothetical protein
MTGINLQNLPVQPLRFVQPSGLMMSQGNGEHLLHARRRILRHKSIPRHVRIVSHAPRGRAQAAISASPLVLQEFLHAPTDEYRDVGLDSRNLFEFGVFDAVDFMHGFNRHIGFTRQKFNVRFQVLRLHYVVAHSKGFRAEERGMLP